MGCDCLKTAAKRAEFEKVKANAKIEAKEKQKPQSIICGGKKGFLIMDAAEAIRTNKEIMDTISEL